VLSHVNLRQLVAALYRHFLRPGKDLKKLGKWAIVTGATDGIGKAYAVAFAKRGLSVVLVSRSESKLRDVQAEILTMVPKANVRYVVCDFSRLDAASKKSLLGALDTLDIGILVNNVGLGYRYPRFFHELPDEEVKDLIALNVESTVWMTHMILPGMLERRRGAIINLSSGSALYTLPLLAEYSGAKSFVEKFSRALNAEYRNQGVTCQCQVPFYVATKLAKLRRSLMVPTPAEYVARAINWVGYPDAVAQPFWLHAIQGYVLSVLPDYLVARIIYSMHFTTRKKGMQKEQRGKNE
jgi:17beta-estradiol 17-dehydrogenase / very-long-chain 3-oxoacyl-CoA reductase